MKKLFVWLLILAAGCSSVMGVGARGSGGENIEKRTPDILDLFITEEFHKADTEECFVYVTYPELHLGRQEVNGEVLVPERYEQLEQALELHNLEIYVRQQMELARMGSMEEYQTGECYSEMDLFVTRNDDQMVSFYEHTVILDKWGDKRFEWNAYNFDSATGEERKFEDVFQDVKNLPAFLADEFAKNYPDLEISFMADELIEESIREEDGYLSFALGYDCIHIFAADWWLANASGGQHITLSYQDYPELVKEQYQIKPSSYLTKLDYDTDYILQDGMRFSMEWEMQDEAYMEGMWTVVIDETVYSELYYGHAPECYLLQNPNGAYIYLHIPSGDVSMLTNIYEITEEGLVLNGWSDTAIDSTASLNPGRMKMSLNTMAYAGSTLLMPYGWYSPDELGLPMLEEGFGLIGNEVTLLKDIQVSENVSLASGTILTPFATDLDSYVDFLDMDGRTVRFEINEFSWEMEFLEFGAPEELFY